MASNSSITVQNIIDYAKTFADLQPVLAVGGYSLQPALTIASDTIAAMLSPALNWKWNRFKVPAFYTNSLQRDYAIPGVVGLGWLEHGFVVDINNTATPPPVWPLEVVRDLEVTSNQWGRIGQVAWLPNDQLTYGTWQANTTYTKILGTPSNPGTALTQIQDPNGNFWVLSNNLNATVTTGPTEPNWPPTSSITYPTYSNPTATATTVTDDSVIWMAVNPKGQGIRVSPLPPQGGIYWQVNLVGQMRPPAFTSVQQTLDPVPDDYAPYFRQGFIAHAYRHASDPKTQAKFKTEFQLWINAMTEALKKSDRERDAAGFYPSESLMSSGYPVYPGPAWPYSGIY